MRYPGDAGRPDPKAVKMEVSCRTCHASLPVSPTSRVIICDYCGAKNVVPEEIWNVVSPPPPPAPLPPGPALPPPAVPQKKNPTIIFIIVGVMFAMLVLPMLFVFCGACIPLIGAIFSAGRKPDSSITITTGTPDTVLNLNSPLQTVPAITNAATVKPSFANADASATIDGIFALVRSNWSQDARLERVIMSKVRPDGSMDLAGSGEGSMIIEFIIPDKAKGLQPGETKVKGGKLQIILSNNNIIEMEQDLMVSELSSQKVIDAVPGCSTAQLWQKAVKEGYPPAGAASIEFPVVPPDLTAKEKKKEEKYYSYRFFNPETPPIGKPMYFTLADCTPR